MNFPYLSCNNKKKVHLYRFCTWLVEVLQYLWSAPNVTAILVVKNLPYKFQKSYGDFQNRNFEKSHIWILAWMLVELLVHGRI